MEGRETRLITKVETPASVRKFKASHSIRGGTRFYHQGEKGRGSIDGEEGNEKEKTLKGGEDIGLKDLRPSEDLYFLGKEGKRGDL